MSVIGLKALEEENDGNITNFKNDVKIFTIDDTTEMVIDSKEFETEITFIKELPQQNTNNHDSTYVQNRDHDANGDFVNQYGSRYSYFNSPDTAYKYRGY